MGTNYYIDLDFCKHCERSDRIHLGKSSFGWKFAIEIHKIYYKTFKEFVEFIRDKRIVDEYHKEITFDEIMDMIERKKGHKSHFENYPKSRYADCEKADLMKEEFS